MKNWYALSKSLLSSNLPVFLLPTLNKLKISLEDEICRTNTCPQKRVKYHQNIWKEVNLSSNFSAKNVPKLKIYLCLHFKIYKQYTICAGRLRFLSEVHCFCMFRALLSFWSKILIYVYLFLAFPLVQLHILVFYQNRLVFIFLSPEINFLFHKFTWWHFQNFVGVFRKVYEIFFLFSLFQK